MFFYGKDYNVDAFRVSSIMQDCLVPDNGTDFESCAGQVALIPGNEYSKLAGEMLRVHISEELDKQDLKTLHACFVRGVELGVLSSTLAFDAFFAEYGEDLSFQDRPFMCLGYPGVKTLYDRYLLRDRETKKVFESIAAFVVRVALGSTATLEDAFSMVNDILDCKYLSSSPTLFNAGTTTPQMSSCYIHRGPDDTLDSLFDTLHELGSLSKFAGGIALNFTRIRGSGSWIEGIKTTGDGIVPWLKTYDTSVNTVARSGRRRGACAVYLETWHADILYYLELRDSTGDHNRRTHNLNLAHWVPDLFMERVEADASWSLFDPDECPELCETWGDEFRAHYEAYEVEGKARATIPARELYTSMMRMIAETSNGWMCFKDTSNRKGNQVGAPGNIIHSSNLCTEITEVTSDGQTAVCNLGSQVLPSFVVDGAIDLDALAESTRRAVRYLDSVIDRNFYPIESARASNEVWRPIGLGLIGFQDALFMLGIPFDSDKAKEIAETVQRTVYQAAVAESCALAKEHGPCLNWGLTRLANAEECPDTLTPEIFEQVREHGCRNSLLIAIAPNATISVILGTSPCIEPYSGLISKRETLSGEMIIIPAPLEDFLQSKGVWNDDTVAAIVAANGSVQGLECLSADEKDVFKTAWELKQKSLIDLAALRTPYVDQSQSLNLFLEKPTIDALSAMYMYAWKQGLKTTYYLRSRPATEIRKTNAAKAVNEEAVKACSIANPEECEMCGS